MAVVINGNSKQNQIVIFDADLERLLSLSGDAVKLYLHVLKYGSDVMRTTVYRRIGLNDTQLAEAERELCAAGLVSIAKDPLDKSYTLTPEPSYTVREISDFKLRDPEFAAAAAEAERIMGKMLTVSDLRMLMKLYHYFGLSAECMFMLLSFTFERCFENGRRITIAALKHESERWLEMGVDSPERADAYIKKEQSILIIVSEIKKTIGKETYTSEERNEIRRWAELGYGTDVIKIAIDISIKRIFEIKIPYMGKIINSWSAQGLHAAQDIVNYEERQKTVFDKRATVIARKNGGSQTQKRNTELTKAELESLKQTEEFFRNGGGE